MKIIMHMGYRCVRRASAVLVSLSLLLQPCVVLALAPSSEMKELSEDAQRRMQAMERIKAFLATVRRGNTVGPKANALLKNEHIEILSGLAMILDPQEVERGLRSISFGNLERTAERLEKIGRTNVEKFLDKVLLPQIPVEAFSKAFGDEPGYWAESLEILYFNSRRLPWMFQLLGADAVAAAIAGNTLNANGAMRELLPFGSLKKVENIADSLGMARSEFVTLFARDPKRLSQIALSLSSLSATQKKALFDVFPRSSYVQAMLQNRNEFQAFLDAMRGMKSDQFAALMADAKERDADLQQKFENHPDTFLLAYAGMPLHAWAAEHEESQATQGRRSYRDAFKGMDPRALVKEALIEKKRRFQVLEERNEFDIASTEMGDLIDRDDDDAIAKCSALVGGARHVVDWDSQYPYKRTMERIRFVAIEGFPLDAWYDEGSLSGGFPTIYVSWDMMRAYMDRVKDDDAPELDLTKVEDDPGLDLAKEELADIFYRLVTEHSLIRDIQVQEDLSPEEAANKARALVESYGDAQHPFFNEEKRNKMMQARGRITRVLSGLDKEVALKTALAELPLQSQSQEIPPGLPAPEIIQQLRDMRAAGGQNAPRDYSTTTSGADLEMTYAQHEAVIDPFIQRAAKEGNIAYLSPRSPPAREILKFLQWLGERSGSTELPALFETLLTTSKENSPTQVKWVHASSTNPLPVIAGETIVGHAGDHGIYAFIADEGDERLATQRLVHEFGARLGFPAGEINPLLEKSFASWQGNDAQGEEIDALITMLQISARPYALAALMPKNDEAPRDYAAKKQKKDTKNMEKDDMRRLAKEVRADFFARFPQEQAFFSELEGKSGHSFAEIAAELLRGFTFASTVDSTEETRLAGAIHLLTREKPRLEKIFLADPDVREILSWVASPDFGVEGSYDLPSAAPPASAVLHLKAVTDLLSRSPADSQVRALVEKLGRFKAGELLKLAAPRKQSQVYSILRFVENAGARAYGFPFVDLASGSNAMEYAMYLTGARPREVVLMDRSEFMISLLNETVRRVAANPEKFKVRNADVGHLDEIFASESIGTLMMRAVAQYVIPDKGWYDRIPRLIVPQGKIVIAVHPWSEYSMKMDAQEMLAQLQRMTWGTPHSDYVMIKKLLDALVHQGSPWKFTCGHIDRQGKFVEGGTGFEGKDHFSETFFVFEKMSSEGMPKAHLEPGGQDADRKHMAEQVVATAA